jgi:hypothetical protein
LKTVCLFANGGGLGRESKRGKAVGPGLDPCKRSHLMDVCQSKKPTSRACNAKAEKHRPEVSAHIPPPILSPPHLRLFAALNFTSCQQPLELPPRAAAGFAVPGVQQLRSCYCCKRVTSFSARNGRPLFAAETQFDASVKTHLA